jgi:hypothetical protein
LVRILCTNQALDVRGGTESYLEAVVPALRELGHDVELYSMRNGRVADQFRARGVLVHDDERDLRSDYDVVHAQHASTALAVRAQLPDVPLVFASHSWFLDLESAPAAAQPSSIVVFNDVVADRIRATALGETLPLHRLAQPVALSGLDNARLPPRDRPRQALAVSRRLVSRLGPLRAACDAAGIELTAWEPVDDPSEHPMTDMMRVDVVFGSGRTILEACALGKAAFVYDESGTAGFLTEENYVELESRGFAPEGAPAQRDLAAMIGQYDASLGPLGRELVVRHHSATRHAVALVGIYRTAAGPTDPTESDVLRRMATLTQQLFEVEAAARTAAWEAAGAARAVHDLRARLAVVQAELDAVRHTRSWRLTAPLRRLPRRRRSRPEPDGLD